MLLFYEIIYFILFHIFCKKCIAAIACAEIPNRQWLEVVDILQNIAVQPTSADSLREQALEAIGYLCQDIVSTLFINCQPFKPSLLINRVLQERGDVEIFRKNFFFSSEFYSTWHCISDKLLPETFLAFRR